MSHGAHMGHPWALMGCPNGLHSFKLNVGPAGSPDSPKHALCTPGIPYGPVGTNPVWL